MFSLFTKDKLKQSAFFDLPQNVFGCVTNLVDILFDLFHDSREGVHDANKVGEEDCDQYPQKNEADSGDKKENF